MAALNNNGERKEEQERKREREWAIGPVLSETVKEE